MANDRLKVLGFSHLDFGCPKAAAMSLPAMAKKGETANHEIGEARKIAPIAHAFSRCEPHGSIYPLDDAGHCSGSKDVLSPE
jgi:hypothetical protein